MTSRQYRNDGLDSHHMPAQESAEKSSLPGWTKSRGPAIQMTPTDHHRTFSNGRQGILGIAFRAQIAAMISKGDMRGAMAREIRDVRRVARNVGDPAKYNAAMIEMMDYARSAGFIPKNPQTKIPRTR